MQLKQVRLVSWGRPESRPRQLEERAGSICGLVSSWLQSCKILTKDFWGINILYAGGIRDHGRVLGGVLHWCADINQQDILALSLAEQLESLLHGVVGALADALDSQGVDIKDREQLEEYVRKNRYICVYRGKKYFHKNKKSCWAQVECLQSATSAEVFLKIVSKDIELTKKIAETRPNPFIFQIYMADIQWKNSDQAALNIPSVGEFFISCHQSNTSPLGTSRTQSGE